MLLWKGFPSRDEEAYKLGLVNANMRKASWTIEMNIIFVKFGYILHPSYTSV